MLYQGEANDQQRDYLGKIKNTVKRMEMLVSDLADISRIESGHFFMDETIVPVEAIIQAVKDGNMPEITARKHTLCRVY
jgi:signal transduction histidine kinase